jgi:hypothetical protein
VHGPGDECHNTTRVGTPASATSLLFCGDPRGYLEEDDGGHCGCSTRASGIVHMAVPQGMGMGIGIEVVQVITALYNGGTGT